MPRWGPHAMNTAALASVAGVCGANSVVGAWRHAGEKVKHLLTQVYHDNRHRFIHGPKMGELRL